MRIAVLPGDGIGPEVIRAAEAALRELVPEMELVHGDVGLECHSRRGEYLPEETIDLIKGTDAALFGAISTPLRTEGYRSPILTMRKELDLYANLRPVKNLAPGVGLVDLDVIIVRENTEGMYTGDESVDADGVTLGRRVSRRACERICRFAREHGESSGRSRLTCVHKANVLRRSDGLFRDVFYDTATGSHMSCGDMLVDAAAAEMVVRPEALDVIVTLNLYGDILSDEAAALAGGLGVAPSANIGDRHALFEPVHGSAPDIAGRNVANPSAALLSAAMMLEHLDMEDEADALRSALRGTVAAGGRTRDLGGNLGTEEFASLVVEGLRRRRAL